MRILDLVFQTKMVFVLQGSNFIIYRFLQKLSLCSLKVQISQIPFGESGTILSSTRQLATHQNMRMLNKGTRPVPLKTVCLSQPNLSFLSRHFRFYLKVTVNKLSKLSHHLR